MVLNYQYNCVLLLHHKNAGIGFCEIAYDCSSTYLALDCYCIEGNTTYDIPYPSSRKSNPKTTK